MAFVVSAAKSFVALVEQVGADRVEPLGEVIFQADLTFEHEAFVQAVEPPCFGGIETELALRDQRVGDRDTRRLTLEISRPSSSCSRAS